MTDSARAQLRRTIAEAAVAIDAPELIGETDPETTRYAREPLELLDYALERISPADPGDAELAHLDADEIVFVRASDLPGYEV